MNLHKLIEVMYLIFLLEYGNTEKEQDDSDRTQKKDTLKGNERNNITAEEKINQ
jgi:hypothetical protein